MNTKWVIIITATSTVIGPFKSKASAEKYRDVAMISDVWISPLVSVYPPEE